MGTLRATRQRCLDLGTFVTINDFFSGSLLLAIDLLIEDGVGEGLNSRRSARRSKLEPATGKASFELATLSLSSAPLVGSSAAQ